MTKIFAANWKMNKTRQQAAESAAMLKNLLGGDAPQGTEVIVFPPFIALPMVTDAFAQAAHMASGAQDMYPAEQGAFTGEISPCMLQDAGAQWVLTGHSERRHVLGEDDTLVGRKTAFALTQGLKVMLCIGEQLAEREGGQLEAVLTRQLALALENVPECVNAQNLAIAYEPVWAIGTGKVASLEEIADVHALVRALLIKRFAAFGQDIAILYGGSVKPSNAQAIIALDNVDGLLVGGASLEAESFAAIINA